ncbi:MAG TPA: cell wall hydrolase [Candidatus Paceibacterota bacterium]|nr:cell wall hydrolase [Candidatus Paceibacterota bacterium]
MRHVRTIIWAILLACTVAGGAKAGGLSEGDDLFVKELYHTALNVYYEARGESELGQEMVAYLTVMRAKADRPMWGGGTILGVIYKKFQFSWTLDSKRKAPTGPEWDQAIKISLKVLRGNFTPPSGLLGEAVYYMNPRTASQKEKCRMATHYRQVGVVGDHYFYSEAPAWLVPPSFGCGKYKSTVPTDLIS